MHAGVYYERRVRDDRPEETRLLRQKAFSEIPD